MEDAHGKSKAFCTDPTDLLLLLRFLSPAYAGERKRVVNVNIKGETL